MSKQKYVGPWTRDQTYTCRHGVPIPYRWVGETEEDSEPEIGEFHCEKCEKGRRLAYEAWERGELDYEGDYGARVD
jgi:hypothetical protein